MSNGTLEEDWKRILAAHQKQSGRWVLNIYARPCTYIPTQLTCLGIKFRHAPVVIPRCAALTWPVRVSLWHILAIPYSFTIFHPFPLLLRFSTTSAIFLFMWWDVFCCLAGEKRKIHCTWLCCVCKRRTDLLERIEHPKENYVDREWTKKTVLSR